MNNNIIRQIILSHDNMYINYDCISQTYNNCTVILISLKFYFQ